MKDIKQLLSSGALLIFGLMIVGMTLRTTHVRAASGDASDNPTHGSQFNLAMALNPHLPGSPLYLSERSWERLQLMWLSDQERVLELTSRINDRVYSAQVARDYGQYESALTTYHKALGYTHVLLHECTTDNCPITDESIAQAVERLETSLQDFSSQVESDSFRSRIDTVLFKVSALREQFEI